MKPVQPAEQVVSRSRRAHRDVSARSALDVGNIMSGVTVAQRRGRGPCPRPRPAPEAAPRGRERKIGERLLGAQQSAARGSPCGSMIHSSEVSTSVESSSS